MRKKKQLDPEFVDAAIGIGINQAAMTTKEKKQDPLEETPVVGANRDPIEPELRTLQDKERDIRHVLTDHEANLLMVAANEEADWDKYAEIIDDYELMKDPLSLPPECAIREERCEFRYRWLDPYDSQRFQRQTDRSFKIRWWIVTPSTARYLPPTSFDASGVVRRMGLILAKMPYWMYLARQKMVWKLADSTWKDHENKQGPGSTEGLEFTGRAGGRFRGGDIRTAQAVLDDSGHETFNMGDVRISAEEAEGA